MPTKTSVTEPLVKHTPHGLGQLSAYTRQIADGGHACLGEVTLKDAQGRQVAGITIRPHRTDAQHISAGQLFAAAPEMLQALREVAGDCYALDGVALGPRCVFCLMREGEPHDPDCTMHFVNAAIARTEGGA